MSVIDRSRVILEWAGRIRQVGRLEVSRILGTVMGTNGSYKAHISLLERSFFLRAEMNAVSAILRAKGLVTEDELMRVMELEYEHLFNELAKEWPEVRFTEGGFRIVDVPAFAARSAREGWPA